MFDKFCVKRTIRNLEPIYNHQKSFYGKAKTWRDVDGNTYLESYDTTVCVIDSEGKLYRLWGGYSKTTLIHVNEFVQQFLSTNMKITASEWRNMEVF